MAAGTTTHLLTESGDILQTEAGGMDDNHILTEAVNDYVGTPPPTTLNYRMLRMIQGRA